MVSLRLFLVAVSAVAWLALPHVEAAPQSRAVELTLPPAPSGQVGLYLSVQVGVITRGTEITITTPSGEQIGTVSPFAIRPGQPAGTYVFPLDPSLVRNGHVTVDLAVTRPGTPTRPPTPDEVPKVGIVYMPVGTAR
jgi:hypothetical protein